jgi:hypothetical protein
LQVSVAAAPRPCLARDTPAPRTFSPAAFAARSNLKRYKLRQVKARHGALFIFYRADFILKNNAFLSYCSARSIAGGNLKRFQSGIA